MQADRWSAEDGFCSHVQSQPVMRPRSEQKRYYRLVTGERCLTCLCRRQDGKEGRLAANGVTIWWLIELTATGKQIKLQKSNQIQVFGGIFLNYCCWSFQFYFLMIVLAWFAPSPLPIANVMWFNPFCQVTLYTFIQLLFRCDFLWQKSKISALAFCRSFVTGTRNPEAIH